MFTNFTEPSASASFFYDTRDEHTSCDDGDEYPDFEEFCLEHNSLEWATEIIEKQIKACYQSKPQKAFTDKVEEFLGEWFLVALDDEQREKSTATTAIEQLEEINSEARDDGFVWEVFNELREIIEANGYFNEITDLINGKIDEIRG